MSKTLIPPKIKNQLLIKSAGRCEYRGCNKSLYQDIITKRNFNSSYIAHIVSDSPDGPRGCKKRSPKLSKDLSNLMLLCDTHHRLIDIEDIGGHPESLLQEMKKNHEERIHRITSIHPNMASYIVTYKANIGTNSPVITYNSVVNYLLPKFYPAIDNTIDLGITDSPQKDDSSLYWKAEVYNLISNFNERLKPLIKKNIVQHISLFALAPIPLLIKLGTLLNDIQNIEIHQPVREPKTWNLTDEKQNLMYQVRKPRKKKLKIALNISLSATIDNKRISSILGNDCCIYTITIDKPFNDFLKSKSQLSEFSQTVRLLLNEIKSKYNDKTPLHIFPAMPVAIAIEFGRVWMPKADMPLVIYDQNKLRNGFLKTIEIK